RTFSSERLELIAREGSRADDGAKPREIDERIQAMEPRISVAGHADELVTARERGESRNFVTRKIDLLETDEVCERPKIADGVVLDPQTAQAAQPGQRVERHDAIVINEHVFERERGFDAGDRRERCVVDAQRL